MHYFVLIYFTLILDLLGLRLTVVFIVNYYI